MPGPPDDQDLEDVLDLLPDPAILGDESLTVIAANAAAHVLWRNDQLVGRRFKDLVAPEAMELYREFVREAESGAAGRFAEQHAAIRRGDGTDCPVDVSVRPVHGARGVRYLATVRDASERAEIVRSLERRDAILGAVAFTVDRLVRIDAEWDAAIDDVLARLGRAADVSRVYVFEVAESGSDWIARQRWEWVAAGIEPQIDNPELQAISFEASGFSRWGDLLAAGECIAGDVREFPTSEQDVLLPQGIDSIVVAPIREHGELWGFIGFDAVGGRRRWLDAEVDALRAAADTIAVAMQNRTSASALRRSQRTYADAYQREREALDRMRGLDAMKDQFLEAVSHELRTPLTAILGFAETLQRVDLDTERHVVDDVVGRIGSNAARLRELLSDLVDLERLTHHGTEAHRTTAPASALLEQACRDASSSLGERKLSSVVAVDEVTVDTSMVTRLLSTLLRNVGRHTPLGTRCWVHLRPDGDVLQISVEDDGPGIPDADKERVFQPFQQGAVVERHAPGTGVGLAVVARFAVAHGGRAWAEDRAGGGTRIVVRLPGSCGTDSVPQLRLVADEA